MRYLLDTNILSNVTKPAPSDIPRLMPTTSTQQSSTIQTSK